jgi:hypothetical protein
MKRMGRLVRKTRPARNVFAPIKRRKWQTPVKEIRYARAS